MYVTEYVLVRPHHTHKKTSKHRLQFLNELKTIKLHILNTTLIAYSVIRTKESVGGVVKLIKSR